MEDGIPRGLQHCPKMCCEKGGYHRRQACMFGGNFTIGMYFQMSGLVYDSIPLLELSLQSPIEFIQSPIGFT